MCKNPDHSSSLQHSPHAHTKATGEYHDAAKPHLILANLGTPEQPTAKAVRPFLREFLGDSRVIEMSSLLWKPILEGIILRVRPRASAKKYDSIWLHEDVDGVHASPLMHYTCQQAKLVERALEGKAYVHVAMRYGSPGVQEVLTRIQEFSRRHREAARVAVLPLYPQYAASSAGTVIDEVARWLLESRDQCELRTVRSFPAADEYIEACASAIEAHWRRVGRPNFAGGDRLVASFHSIPVAMSRKGDPYIRECEATGEALRARLGLTGSELMLTYQSVFGPAQWEGPATIDTMESFGKAGVRRVDVICPGFMADCLETLEEINILNRRTFLEAGGKEFHYVPWANDSEGAILAIEQQAREVLSGWI